MVKAKQKICYSWPTHKQTADEHVRTNKAILTDSMGDLEIDYPDDGQTDNFGHTGQWRIKDVASNNIRIDEHD